MTPNAAITSAAAPNKVDKRKTCAWRADNDGVWHANCGELYVFVNGGPRDNNFRHCPYCGRLIASAPLERRVRPLTTETPCLE